MNKKSLSILFFVHSIFFSQSIISSNKLAIPLNKIRYQFTAFINNDLRSPYKINTNKNIYNSNFNIEFNIQSASNSGHPNIDNSAEFYIPGSSSNLISSRIEFSNKWLNFEIEPYVISHKGITFNNITSGSYRYTNNQNSIQKSKFNDMGFRQSRLVLHYRGLGIGYGYESHWWSPGIHSAISLSSNAPSQKTYSIGTFSDLKINNLSFGAKIIVMPYENNYGSTIYFSGLKAHITYNAKSSIFTFGLHRTYLSGDFNSQSLSNDKTITWSIKDAALLVVEPLFGQSKRNLEYTLPGTPGFDPWDEVLTGTVKLTFPEEELEVYADVSSDDNRGNLTDLKAHWDHTLGYMLCFKKFTNLNNISLFIGSEFLTTRPSNTFNPIFYRGNPNSTNYYSKDIYDYFTYKGRFMGAHSGSSSDDFILMIGIGNKKSMTFVSYNKERHGIKSFQFPEIKTEFSIIYYRSISTYHSFSLSLENEKIRNFNFNNNEISNGFVLGLNYSFIIN